MNARKTFILKHSFSILLIFLFLLASINTGYGQEERDAVPIRIAIVSISGGNLSPQDQWMAEALLLSMRNKFHFSHVLQQPSSFEIEYAVKKAGFKAGETRSEEFLKEAGAILKADYLVKGNLSDKENSLKLIISIYNCRKNISSNFSLLEKKDNFLKLISSADLKTIRTLEAMHSPSLRILPEEIRTIKPETKSLECLKLNTLAWNILMSENPKSARPLLEKALNFDSNCALTYSNLAWLHLIERKYNLAYSYAKEALKLDNRQYQAEIVLSAILFNKASDSEAPPKDLQPALEHAMKAYETAPESYFAVYYIAVSNLMLKNWPEAEKFFTILQELDPENKALDMPVSRMAEMIRNRMKIPDFVFLLLPILVLIICVTFHEMAHSLISYKLGDPTAKAAGRLSLNPVVHMDIIGSIIVPIALVLMKSHFWVAWAKPVPINPDNFKKPRLYDTIVALSGPVFNIILGFFFALLLLGTGSLMKVMNPSMASMNFAAPFTEIILSGVRFSTFWTILIEFLKYGVIINLYLAAFNLIPIPPLDGGHLILNLLPRRKAIWIITILLAGFAAIIALLATGKLNLILIHAINFIEWILSFIGKVVRLN